MDTVAVEKKNILVVDDEKNIRFTVTHALTSDEFDIDEASSGVEGLKKSQERSYDLLLVDLRMPGMTGIEMLREIRRRKAESPPAVVITAYGIPQQLLEAASLGAIDYVRKPFSIQTLRAIVRTILERMSLTDDFRPLTADEHLEVAKRKMMFGRHEEAKENLQSAIALDPRNAEDFLLFGVCLLLESHPDQAREAFQRTLMIDPLNKTASEYLAWLAAAH
jgi:DNA-binding response OmpR family regulator